MESNQNSQNLEEFEEKNTLSIDEFFRQLEEKEQDLDISSEVIIEIDESGYDDEIPEFLKTEFSVEEKKPAKTETNSSNSAADLKMISNLNNEISNLRKQLEKMENERGELLEISRRRQTDFESFKNRTERERRETFTRQLCNLATQMLPVLDNLNRALDAATSFSGEKKQDFQQFFDGIILVNQQLSEVLAGMGVQQINSVGEVFDPHFHEAVATEETENFPPNTITAELLRGYKIDDKVIRPSMVKVSASKKTNQENISSSAK